MARPRRLFIKDTVVEVAFRAEEGLPLPPSPIITQALWGIMAKAQTLFKVEICHFVFMSNHAHMLLVVNDPKDLCDFVGYVKRESSSLINLLLNRRRKTVWVERYDAPTVLDAEKLMERITYIYSNPQQANLVDTIEDYPHLNSWNAMLEGNSVSRHKRIPKNIITPLPKRKWKIREAAKWINQLISQVREDYELRVTPFSWKRCFPETAHLSDAEIRQQIVKRVRREEARLRNERKYAVVGAARLMEEPINAPHMPLKWGMRSICLGSEKRIRKVFIGWFKDIIHQAAKAAEVISKKRWFTNLPPGLFSPGGYLNANIVPWLVPTAWNGFGGCNT